MDKYEDKCDLKQTLTMNHTFKNWRELNRLCIYWAELLLGKDT